MNTLVSEWVINWMVRFAIIGIVYLLFLTLLVIVSFITMVVREVVSFLVSLFVREAAAAPPAPGPVIEEQHHKPRMD